MNLREIAKSRLQVAARNHQVGALKRLVRVGKLENEIRIKRGIPFAPVLGAGVFVAVLYGDLYWWLVLALQGVAGSGIIH